MVALECGRDCRIEQGRRNGWAAKRVNYDDCLARTVEASWDIVGFPDELGRVADYASQARTLTEWESLGNHHLGTVLHYYGIRLVVEIIRLGCDSERSRKH